MNQEDLQIRLKVEEMIRYGYAALRQFPKSEKHVLSAEIRQCMYRLLRLVIICNRRYHKKTTMQPLQMPPRYALCRIGHGNFIYLRIASRNHGNTFAAIKA